MRDLACWNALMRVAECGDVEAIKVQLANGAAIPLLVAGLLALLAATCVQVFLSPTRPLVASKRVAMTMKASGGKDGGGGRRTPMTSAAAARIQSAEARAHGGHGACVRVALGRTRKEGRYQLGFAYSQHSQIRRVRFTGAERCCPQRGAAASRQVGVK